MVSMWVESINKQTCWPYWKPVCLCCTGWLQLSSIKSWSRPAAQCLHLNIKGKFWFHTTWVLFFRSFNHHSYWYNNNELTKVNAEITEACQSKTHEQSNHHTGFKQNMWIVNIHHSLQTDFLLQSLASYLYEIVYWVKHLVLHLN